MKNNLDLHIPVLLPEVLNFIKNSELESGSYLDATFGRGGHALEINKLFDNLKIIAVDQDEEAIEYGKQLFADKLKSEEILFIHSNFSKLTDYKEAIDKFSAETGVAFVLADLGVSSPQLDDAARGFSFYKDGPLDMRMDHTQNLTASEIVNEWSEDELVSLFIEKGEVRRPQKVVEKIIAKRKLKKFERTDELSYLIEDCLGWRKKGQHPATHFFLALRLEVNKELEVVENSIETLLDCLAPGGLLLVITFHSLEDRIVKYKFKELAETKGKILTKKVIQATWEDKKKNKRARSAKLRVFKRGSYVN